MPVGCLKTTRDAQVHKQYPRKNCTKAEVQNCAFSLSSVGRILNANFGAKLSKLCKARSRICSLDEQERQKLQIGHLRLNNLGSICMSSRWIRLVHLALSKDVCANKLCTKSTSGHLPKSTKSESWASAKAMSWMKNTAVYIKVPDLCIIIKKNSGKKENFDEQCQSKL